MVFRVIKSIFKSAGEGIKQDKELIKVKNRFPKTFSFIKKRLTPDEKMGLGLTIGILVFFIFIYLFLVALNGFFAQDVWVMTDLRILNVIKEFRNPTLDELMILVTTFGKKEVVIVGSISVALILFMIKRWYYTISLGVSLLFGEVLVYFLKNSIERPRPPIDLALLKETGFSFPSSHAFTAVSFYGMICYFIFRGVKRRRVKLPILFILTISIMLIGASRVYLGVHWASDVFAGLVSGIAWVNLVITFFEIRRKSDPKPKSKLRFASRKLKIASAVLLSVWLITVYFFYNQKSNEKIKPRPSVDSGSISVSEEEFTKDPFMGLPKMSEKISGDSMEPIHIIVIGSQDDLFKAFKKIGWFACDPLNGKSLKKNVYSMLTNSPYPEAPGVPSIWRAVPNKISFEKPTEANSIRERHHIHFWDTGRFIAEKGREDGRIWFATAHFDTTINMGSSVFLPVHKIDPAIDNERQIIREDLQSSKSVEKMETIQAVKPSLGTNQSGDLFFTDGKAEVIFLETKK